MQHASVLGKAGSFATVQDIAFYVNWKFTSLFIRGLKVYFYVHKWLWLDFPEVAVHSTPHPMSEKFVLVLISHLCLYILSYLFSFDFLTNFYMYFLICCIHAACPPNLILHDLITQIIFCGGLPLWSCLLFNFNQCFVASFFLYAYSHL